MTDTPEILVVCTHNAGRSVAARVLLDYYAAGRITVRSAGSAPGEEVNPAVVEILTERGLDVSKEFPKPLTDQAARSADVIITMDCQIGREPCQERLCQSVYKQGDAVYSKTKTISKKLNH